MQDKEKPTKDDLTRMAIGFILEDDENPAKDLMWIFIAIIFGCCIGMIGIDRKLCIGFAYSVCALLFLTCGPLMFVTSINHFKNRRYWRGIVDLKLLVSFSIVMGNFSAYMVNLKF